VDGLLCVLTAVSMAAIQDGMWGTKWRRCGPCFSWEGLHVRSMAGELPATEQPCLRTYT
jgi:hypothetical protein